MYNIFLDILGKKLTENVTGIEGEMQDWFQGEFQAGTQDSI